MKAAATVLIGFLLAHTSATTAFKECDGQERFDIMMCKSHMCTKCVLAWCTESCQKVQKDYPTCRYKDWPSARASYSSGDFEGKGKDWPSARASYSSGDFE